MHAFNRRSLIGAVAAFGGAALLPFVMTIGAAACWGVANIVTKRAGKIERNVMC